MSETVRILHRMGSITLWSFQRGKQYPWWSVFEVLPLNATVKNVFQLIQRKTLSTLAHVYKLF